MAFNHQASSLCVAFPEIYSIINYPLPPEVLKSADSHTNVPTRGGGDAKTASGYVSPPPGESPWRPDPLPSFLLPRRPARAPLPSPSPAGDAAVRGVARVTGVFFTPALDTATRSQHQPAQKAPGGPRTPTPLPPQQEVLVGCCVITLPYPLPLPVPPFCSPGQPEGFSHTLTSRLDFTA